MAKPDHNIRFTRSEDRKLGLLQSKEKQMEKIEAWIAEDDKKLDELCVHYGIEHNDFKYRRLALKLAREFLPAPLPKVRKTKWTEWIGGILVVEVERIMESGQANKIREATKLLANMEPWCDFIEEKSGINDFGPDPGEALRRQYNHFKDSKSSRVMFKVYKYHETTDSIEEWTKMIDSFLDQP